MKGPSSPGRAASPLAAPSTMTATLTLPWEAVTVRAEPEFISQHTSEPILGLTRRVFLDLLPMLREAGVRVISLGKARLVPRSEIVAFLLARAPLPVVASLAAANDADELDVILAKGGTVRQ